MSLPAVFDLCTPREDVRAPAEVRIAAIDGQQAEGVLEEGPRTGSAWRCTAGTRAAC